MADRMTARLTEPDGKAVDLGEMGSSGWLTDAEPHQPIWVPDGVYNRVKDQPVRLEMDYSLTLLKVNPARSIPASAREARIPDVGRCAALRDTMIWPTAGGAQIELRCFAPGKPPCATWFIENTRTGARSSSGSVCSADYAPYFGGIDGDSMSHFGAGLWVRESQLRDSRVVVWTYRPEAHFTRQVVIPDIRLSDWKAEREPIQP
jgi:hypothetical protein